MIFRFFQIQFYRPKGYVFHIRSIGLSRFVFVRRAFVFRIVSKGGIRRGAEAIVQRPMMELRRGAPAGRFVSEVVRGIPACIVRPTIGATEAITTTLRGVRNQVDRQHHQNVQNKFKGPQV